MSFDEESLSLDDKMELLTQLSEIAHELGWYIGVPPGTYTKGLIIGSRDFIEKYNEQLLIDDQFELLDEESMPYSHSADGRKVTH